LLKIYFIVESTPRSVFLTKSRRIPILKTEFTCCKWVF